MTSQINESAKVFFYNKQYKEALNLFMKENNCYASGLCCLLLKDEKNAKKFWDLNKKNCPACDWGLIVLDFIHLKLDKQPKFFQTRAFLEVYLNLFIENGFIEWSENLIGCCDKLYRSNPESYKFIARALYSNGYFDLAITFCKKSLRLFYADPEAFLILSQCQYLLGDLAEAMDSINRVLSMVDDYYPAILFRGILKEEITKKRKN